MNYLTYCLITMLIFISCSNEKSNYLVEYKYYYANDSLNKSIKDEENMILHITDSGFVFLPKQLFEMDTVGGIDINRIMKEGKKMSFFDVKILNYQIIELGCFI